MSYLSPHYRWAVISRNSTGKSRKGRSFAIVVTPKTEDFDNPQTVCYFVPPSISLLFPRSTRRPKCARKSEPIIAEVTSACKKFHENFRRSPRSTETNLLLYVRIFVPFAAWSKNGDGSRVFSILDAGISVDYLIQTEKYQTKPRYTN